MIGTRTSSSYTPHVDVAPADRPLILVAPRWEEAKPFLSETLSPNEEIASVFVDAILAAGGLPLQMSITEDIEVIRHYVDIADGIAIPGGPDVNPKRWGDDRPYDPTLCCEIRDSFEFKLVGEVLRAKKPLFTTCRGTQLLNVATGATLCMDVPSLGAREGRTQWRHTHVLNDPVHPVEVVPGSLLERAVGGHRLIQTNSAHHCCVDRLGKSTRLVAKATDGVPECIEVEGQPFCLGVQWHPEYTWQTLETDFNLGKSFVEAAAKVKQARELANRITDKGAPPATWSGGAPFCPYAAGTQPKAHNLLLARLAQSRHRSRILLLQRMHSLASVVNGIGAAQRLGHHDRRLVQIIESRVLAHALERVRCHKRTFGVSCRHGGLQLVHALVIQKLEGKAGKHFLAHQPSARVIIISADLLIRLTHGNHGLKLLWSN